MKPYLIRLLLVSVLAGSGWANSVDTITAATIDAFPKRLSSDCRGGKARLYDECGSQAKILAAAIDEAKRTNKTALLLIGAEWCVWCFILDDALHGKYESTYFEYQRDQNSGKWLLQENIDPVLPRQARLLNEYVAENFVIAHIEADVSPDGMATIDSIGINSQHIKFYPLIVALDDNGQYTNHVFGYEVMASNKTRKDRHEQPLKQFDRAALLKRLTSLREANQ